MPKSRKLNRSRRGSPQPHAYASIRRAYDWRKRYALPIFPAPLFGKFHSEYPDIQLQVTNRTTPDTVELLKVGKVDIALVNLPVNDSSLQVREVLNVHDVFVASSRFLISRAIP